MRHLNAYGIKMENCVVPNSRTSKDMNPFIDEDTKEVVATSPEGTGDTGDTGDVDSEIGDQFIEI